MQTLTRRIVLIGFCLVAGSVCWPAFAGSGQVQIHYVLDLPAKQDRTRSQGGKVYDMTAQINLNLKEGDKRDNSPIIEWQDQGSTWNVNLKSSYWERTGKQECTTTHTYSGGGAFGDKMAKVRFRTSTRNEERADLYVRFILPVEMLKRCTGIQDIKGTVTLDFDARPCVTSPERNLQGKPGTNVSGLISATGGTGGRKAVFSCKWPDSSQKVTDDVFARASKQGMPKAARDAMMRAQRQMAESTKLESMEVSGSFDFTGQPSRLKAVTGTYAAVERGQKLTLDGSKSEGDIKSYEWRFHDAKCGNGVSVPEKKVQGATVSIRMLCPITATLTVSDGKKTSEKSTRLTIKQRDWQTEFAHEKEPVSNQNMGRLIMKGGQVRVWGGADVCSIDDSGLHFLHPGPQNSSWEGGAYEMEQFVDSGGLFDGLWWVSEKKWQVSRRTYLNAFMLPGGPEPATAVERFYDANKRMGTDIDGYIRAVKNHEGTGGVGGRTAGHTSRLVDALRKIEPGRKIERLISNSRDDLKQRVDADLDAAEKALCEATNDPLPMIWPAASGRGRLAFPNSHNAYKYELGAQDVKVGGPGSPDQIDCSKSN